MARLGSIGAARSAFVATFAGRFTVYDEAASARMHAFWAERDRFGQPDPVNVYYLDHDPVLAAQMHCDAHIDEALMYSAILLSSAHHKRGCVASEWSPFIKDIELPRRVDPHTFMLSGQRIYPPEHMDHPCSEWVRESRANYEWLWKLSVALLKERKHRFDGRDWNPVFWTLESIPLLPLLEQTEPPCAMPEECKVAVDGMYDAVASYRNYYLTAKRYLLQWTRRRPPAWVQQAEQVCSAIV